MALFLLALIGFPLISTSLHQYKSEIKDLQYLKMEKIASDSLADVIERLYNQIPPWQNIVNTGKKPTQTLPSVNLTINKKTIKIERSYEIKCVDKKNFTTEDGKEEYRLILIEISLFPPKNSPFKEPLAKKDYQFEILIKKSLNKNPKLLS